MVIAIFVINFIAMECICVVCGRRDKGVLSSLQHRGIVRSRRNYRRVRQHQKMTNRDGVSVYAVADVCCRRAKCSQMHPTFGPMLA